MIEQPTATIEAKAQQPTGSAAGAGFSVVAGSGNWLTAAESRGYAEDRDLENGNYLNRCRACGEHFIGHKRRVFCKPCNLGIPSTSLPGRSGAQDAQQETGSVGTGGDYSQNTKPSGS